MAKKVAIGNICNLMLEARTEQTDKRANLMQRIMTLAK